MNSTGKTGLGIAGADSLQALWSATVDRWGPGQIEFVGTTVVQLVSFWIPCAIYFAIERLTPRYSAAHKLQKPEAQPTMEDYRVCLGRVLKNQVYSLLMMGGQFVLTEQLIPADRPDLRALSTSRELPHWTIVVRDLTISLFLREVLFYYSHRILHHKMFYARIHKLHHKFTAPMALAAQYAHFFEHLVANTIPIVLPSILLRSHITVFWLFLASQLLETTAVHSGFDFYARIAKHHDLHHEKFLIYFGSLGVLDWLHGTDGSNRKQKRN